MDINWTRGPIIGRGSTATVSIATSSSGEIFAVKFADLSSSAFLRKEQSILSTLSSPHIVKYIGSGLTRKDDGLVYNILMEYVSGGSLHDLIKSSGGKLPDPAIRSYTRQILKGLLYLHERGIVHCDLKSRNVLVDGNGAVLKIADMGCAKPVSNTEFSGTPAFMAPEVARGEEQRFPADVWALGCTVIEMMTGSSPWPELNDVVAAVYKIGFSGDSPEIPGWIMEKAKDFLMNCLKIDPKQRWTVEELLKHPFLVDDEDCQSSDCLHKTSSPSTVLDQRFWDSSEAAKSNSISMDHEAPFVDYSESWDSPADRIVKLAGDEFSNVPKWDTVDDGDWIQVRGDELGETEKLDGDEDAMCVEATTSSEAIEGVEDWISNQDSFFSEYSSDSIISNLLFSKVAIEGNLITFYYAKNVSITKLFPNNNNENKENHSSVKLHATFAFNSLTKTEHLNIKCPNSCNIYVIVRSSLGVGNGSLCVPVGHHCTR